MSDIYPFPPLPIGYRPERGQDFRELPADHQHAVILEPWQDINLVNNWANSGPGIWETAQYRKTPWGEVIVKGLISGGTGDLVGTLPVGYRPKKIYLFRVYTHFHTDATIQVSSDGTISTAGTHNSTFLGLNFSFYINEEI